jgi:hypothetical protein
MRDWGGVQECDESLKGLSIKMEHGLIQQNILGLATSRFQDEVRPVLPYRSRCLVDEVALPPLCPNVNRHVAGGP